MIQERISSIDSIKVLLSTISDPEVPAISIVELGIVRDVRLHSDFIEIIITPTYSGCPAMKMIEDEIRRVLMDAGLSSVSVTTVFSPAWTTEWISDDAKLKLKRYGIAPPVHSVSSPLLQIGMPKILCPHCNSADTTKQSEFGSTACKAYYYCQSCRQAFEYFKSF
ncbi:MAG: 1,2-phenylacetyl-CoA epoxidase subunit PaaD [Bacteroidota bacterium]